MMGSGRGWSCEGGGPSGASDWREMAGVRRNQPAAWLCLWIKMGKQKEEEHGRLGDTSLRAWVLGEAGTPTVAERIGVVRFTSTSARHQPIEAGRCCRFFLVAAAAGAVVVAPLRILERSSLSTPRPFLRLATGRLNNRWCCEPSTSTSSRRWCRHRTRPRRMVVVVEEKGREEKGEEDRRGKEKRLRCGSIHKRVK